MSNRRTTDLVQFNLGHLKSWRGILQSSQVMLGIVSVGLMSYYYNIQYGFVTEATTFFLLISVTYLISTFILLIACISSVSTANVIPKTNFEIINHVFAVFLYAVSSATLMVHIKNEIYSTLLRSHYNSFLAAGLIGWVLSGLHLMGAIFGYKTYKGL